MKKKMLWVVIVGLLGNSAVALKPFITTKGFAKWKARMDRRWRCATRPRMNHCSIGEIKDARQWLKHTGLAALIVILTSIGIVGAGAAMIQSARQQAKESQMGPGGPTMPIQTKKEADPYVATMTGALEPVGKKVRFAPEVEYWQEGQKDALIGLELQIKKLTERKQERESERAGVVKEQETAEPGAGGLWMKLKNQERKLDSEIDDLASQLQTLQEQRRTIRRKTGMGAGGI